MIGTRFLTTATLILGAGCSSADFEVASALQEGGEVVVDPSAPDALATLRVSVGLAAGRFAGGPVEIARLDLYEDEAVWDETVSIATQISPPVALRDGERRTVTIENLDSLNVDLAPLCGRSLLGRAWLPIREGAFVSGPSAQVRVRCL